MLVFRSVSSVSEPWSRWAKCRRSSTICWMRLTPCLERCQHPFQVLAEVGQVDLLGQVAHPPVQFRLVFFRQLRGLGVELKQLGQVVSVALDYGEIVRDEGQGIVDLVGHARHQLAQRRQLGRVDQLTLGAA